ncbi:unnamed protein product [Rotaria sp. Silwood1]|nr:unnamed protein product [Rotaria sp. Silwood1]CAF1299508.1 unnamed protein product [Rotaria sp. Silwood1]CAF3468001.1 unnamed protein product [Rotaria sp. Silwood1]
MFSFFSTIFIIFAIIVKSYGNPVYDINNITDVDNSDAQSHVLCNENDSFTDNNNLFELLNNERYWFVLARSTFIYGEKTWNNILMQTSTTINGTIYLEFIGENSYNSSCVNSQKGQIVSNTKSNRVSIHWPNEKGFLEILFIDEAMIHFILCYSIESNQTDVCARNQSEHFVMQNNEQEHGNDTMLWLKSHCSSINLDDFIVNDNPKKCVRVVFQPEIVDSDPVEQPIETSSQKIFETTYSEVIEQETIPVTSMPELDFTTRTNRTNRLEVLEEYYNNVTTNSTNEDQLEQTIPMKTKEIVVPATDTSSSEQSDQANLTSVQQNGYVEVIFIDKRIILCMHEIDIVLESVANETVDGEVPVLVLHKTVMTETTAEVLLDNLEMTQSVSTQSLEKNESTNVNIHITTAVNPSTVSVSPTTAKEILYQPTTSLHVEDSTILVNADYERNTTIVEGRIELTTVDTTIPTTVVPTDCPVLKDCPFDYCAFARKFDIHGCPTCHCIQANKSNIICPTLTCQECLYGHYTDPYGCPICQCQNRPYPPLGERCPQLNCDPCYFGTVKDEYNCDTCVCIRPNSQECPVLNCTFGLCKYGSVKDEDDCPTCDCLLPTTNTTEVNCTTPISCPSCHLGYVTDADGCQTCQCKFRGSAPCASVSFDCQCEYGSYLNSDGCETCSCLPDPKSASGQACWELLNEAKFYNISGPKCASDGSFYARQCDISQSKCWCVTSTGIRINGFESKPEENVNCGCAVELYQVSSLRMIGHHLLCLLNGNYAPIQCDGRYCSCVDENGKLIGPTVSIQNRDQLRCVGVYQQLHPERFLLHRAIIEQSNGTSFPYGISSSLCLTHLEQVRNAKIIDDHILIPVCDANGLYASVQCDQSERYCWCVDKKTGVEMDGTRRLNARPNCSII